MSRSAHPQASGSSLSTSTTSVPPTDAPFHFSPMSEALAAYASGEFVVVMDNEDRENEGDLILAASKITTRKMAWFIRHTSGYICVSLPSSRLEELQIPMMVPENQDRNKTAYTVTVDVKEGTTTGISAHDRALTALALSNPASKAEDFARPGHMVPLRYTDGGVLVRGGHTESAVDLCLLTSLPPVGLLCELVKPDDPEGSMARRDDCAAFATKWGLKIISVEMIGEEMRKRGLGGAAAGGAVNGHAV